MPESKLGRVQKLAVQPGYSPLNCRIDDRVVTPATINSVADDWVFQPHQVDANLVGSTCLQFDVQQCEPGERFTDPIERQGGAAAANNCHAHAITRVARNRLIDLSLAMF